MSSSKEVGLSSEELRKRLYQTFKNRGVLDTLKAQMRNQLIQELKQPLLTGPGPQPLEPLLVSACNSVIADHLRSAGYEYTLSVFCPESGFSKEKIFTKEDLLQLLRIRPESALYTYVLSKENSNKGFLFSLLTQLMNHYTQSLRQDADVQTSAPSAYGESLVEKMKVIDKEYERTSCSEDKMFSLHSKLAAYRKETEAQMEAEMNTKLQHFKEVEIAKVRIEEKSKFHKEFENLKQELERTYEMKAKALLEREKNAIDRLQKQQEIEERSVYMQRQSMLKDIETLRNRENELKMRMEAFEKTCQIHVEKVKTTDELLRRRELAVRTTEDTYDQRLKNELSRYQLELKEEFMKRTEKLTESENRNQAETARIQKESAVIDSRLEDHNRTCSELKRVQLELDTAKQQISLLTQQKELLRERLESTSDYPSLKREKAELQGQMQLLKKQLEEAQEENRHLHTEMSKPSKGQLALQMELQRLQNVRRLDEEEFDNQKQLLQAQLQNEVERCAQLKAQLMACEERSQWLTNHVEDMKTQLRQTQQALENEVLRNPKPSLVDRSVLDLSVDKLVPPDIYMDRALLRARVGYNDVYEAGGPPRGHKSPWKDSSDSDMELVVEAKTRIQELQKEAESLEEAYRNYQQRAVHSTISHMLPPRPLSPQQTFPANRASSAFRKQEPPHSTHKPKTSIRQSPQSAKSPVLVFHDTRNSSQPTQLRVTFLEDHDQPQTTVLTNPSHHFLTEPLLLRDEQPQDDRCVASEDVTGPPESGSWSQVRKGSGGEAVVSPVVFPQLPSDRRLSCEVTTTGDFSPELSPPHSPQLRSTAREESSPPKLQSEFPSSESSPQPEKINLEDLTGVLSEPGHIPELLLDTAVPLSEEAPDRPAAPHSQDLPENPKDFQGLTGESMVLSIYSLEVIQTSGESAGVEEEVDDEQRWEMERKERQERRQRELEEAKERERQELKRLEKEMLLQEMEQSRQVRDEEEETEGKTEEDEGLEEKADENREESTGENPLEKYMKMVLESRERQRLQKEAGQTSPEEKSLSVEKEER
ncbi:centriole and centriolar satellite protein ofd1 [Xenentodon cancila]